MPQTGGTGAKKQTMEVNKIIALLNVFYIRIRGDCMVSEANGCGLVDLGLIPERNRKFPLRQHVQIASGAHPVAQHPAESKPGVQE